MHRVVRVTNFLLYIFWFTCLKDITETKDFKNIFENIISVENHVMVLYCPLQFNVVFFFNY